MNKAYVFAARCFAAFTLTGAAQAAQPVPFDAIYESNYGIMSARGERKLEAGKDGLWKMQNSANVLMVDVIERSTFTWQNDRALAQTYEFINNGSKQTLQLAPGAYDKLSYQAQMQINVCANPDKYAGENFTVVDRKRLKTYRVELVGRDVQKTPAGMLNTIHLKQFRPDKRDGKDTQIWLAADWNCLLVRLDQYEGNDIVSLKFVSAKVNGVEVKGK